MLAHKHSAYQEEKENLDLTCFCLEEEINYLSKEISKMEDEIGSLKRTSGGIYSDEMVVKTTIQGGNKRRLNLLERAKDKPYFGRIDFKDFNNDIYETFYVGKSSLTRRKDEKRLMIDWRTPMASLYYSGEIGEVMYKAPGGLIIGELNLKRQYEIQQKKLINIFDKGLTPMDEYLQEALWEKKDNRLRDIVTTIQGEQNNIIRADKDNVLIVQGVAGSGKTTIVLHRIAYLMYTYQEIFDPEKLLIVVPNNLFLNYISDVLPDLGVEEIKQTTFEDLATELLGEEYNLTEIESKLQKLLDYREISTDYREKLQLASWFKGSLLFKDMIDKYIQELSEEIIPRSNLSINENMIFSYEEVKEMFDKDFKYLPLIPRAKRIRRYIEDNIKDRIEKLQQDIIEKYDKKAKNIKARIEDKEELRKELTKLYDERDEKKSILEKSISSSIARYFKEWTEVEINNLYKEIIGSKEFLVKHIGNEISFEDIQFISNYSQEVFSNGQIEREDLPPLLYLNLKLQGLSLKGKFNHIVVDEAQDYSQLQMYILKELSSNSSFTIVGDISQGIYSYKGIKDWKELFREVFSKEEHEFLTIRKCYRSTMEIMNFANQVIKKWDKEDLVLAEPVLRSGDKPYIIKKDSKKSILLDISNRIGTMENEGHKSIAIICKTNDEGRMVYEELKQIYSGSIHLITDKDTAYEGGVVVVPAYLAKGLEFDVVMVYNCSKDNYFVEELDIKLLYVSVTRPLHKLFIYYDREPSPLINIEKDYYNSL